MDPRNGPKASFLCYADILRLYKGSMPRIECGRVYAFLFRSISHYRSNEGNPLPPSAASSTPSTAMPRRSGGRPAPRAAPRPAPARSPPPAPVNHAPPPAPAQGGGGSMLSGIGSTIAQGMAFGTGSAMAHRAVDSVLGPRTIQHETVAAAAPEATTNSVGGVDACNIHSKAFQDCVNNFGSDISKCQFYMDMLAECRKNNGSMLGA